MPLVRELCRRLGAPRAWRELAVAVAREHLNVHRAFELRPGTLIRVLGSVDAWRRPERFARFLEACAADARGRAGSEDEPYRQAEYLEAVRAAASQVRVETEGRSGPAIGRAIDAARVEAAAAVRERFRT